MNEKRREKRHSTRVHHLARRLARRFSRRWARCEKVTVKPTRWRLRVNPPNEFAVVDSTIQLI